MDFNLTEEEKLIQQMAMDLCRKEIEPIAGQMDIEGRIPDELLKKYSELGLFGMNLPREYGGSGANDFAHLLAIEQLAYAGSPAWWPVAFNNSLPHTIHHFGTDYHRERFLKGNLDGTRLFSIQFTEPETGSDPDALLTFSRPDGDYFIINGHKRFSTFGARHGPALLWTKDESGSCTCFVVDKLAPGYSAPKIWDLMGSGGAESVDVFYEDFTVHKDQILGEKGKGLEVLLYWIAIEKLQSCMAGVALAQAALDEAIQYTKNRKVGKITLSDMQSIRFDLADMYSRIEACRWMVYHVAHIPKEDQSMFQREAAACKILIQPLVSQVIEASFKLHGCYGYTKDFKIERLYRAQPGNMVISVGPEINKAIVGASLVK